MASEWREVRLGEVATITSGKRPPAVAKSMSPEHPVPVVGGSGVMGFTSSPLFEEPVLVTGRVGTLGRLHRLEQPSWPSDNALVIRPADSARVDYRYLYYGLLDAIGVAERLNRGSSNPLVTQKDLALLQISLPPLPEQRAIAHILGTLDDKIELLQRMSETLEQMARAIFKAWFVDFEPVRAKMEGRWKRGQSLPGLPAHLYDLFPDRLVDSELGEIPEGWEVVQLSEIFEINPHRRLRKGEVAPYLDMVNMPTQGHMPSTVVPRPFSSGSRFMNGDTLLARITPCLENGKTAFVNFLAPGEVGWGSTEFIVLRPKPPLPPEFGYCLARHSDFREFAIQSMTGTSGRQRVQPEALALYQLAMPPEPIAQAFGRFVQPLFAKASHASSESRTLAALRDALLPKLISGEIRVKDAERFLKERGIK